MTEADRVLHPLREQDAAIERLDTYASAGELADAIASVHAGLERSVRLFLRTDPGAPESARMSALGSDTPFDAVVTALRRRDRISMALAGRLHEADTVGRRVAGGSEPRASDADALRSAAHLLRDEVRSALTADAPRPPSSGPVFALEEAPQSVELPETRSRSPLLPVIGLVLLIAIAGVLLVRGGGDTAGEREAALQAFRAGELGVARTRLEAVLDEDPADVTALLYLARIHRREGRLREAGEALRTAAAAAPEDADVRRELGWLFLDLDQPESAAQQFRLARDAEPAVTSNWIGLVRALREANDPSAEEVLRQAPPEAQAALGEAR